jgi:hypothetical protein
MTNIHNTIINLDVTKIAEFYCGTCNQNIDFEKYLLRPNFTIKNVSPVIQILYLNELTNNTTLKRKFKEFGENSLQEQKTFIKNLLHAIDKQHATNTEMQRLVNTKETTEELKRQLDDAKKEIAILKNTNDHNLSIMRSQKKKILDTENSVNDLSTTIKLLNQSMNHKDELLKAKDCIIEALHLATKKQT